MKEDTIQNGAKKLKFVEIKAECSSTPKIIFACSKCGKTLACEDAYLMDTGQKLTNSRFEDATLLGLYCEACLPQEKQIEKT